LFWTNDARTIILNNKSFIVLIVCCFLFTLPVQPQAKYIQTKDTHFILDGKPYYFVGTNFWYGCYLGSTGQTGNSARLIRELERLKSAGINNLRILGSSEASSASDAIRPAIQISPGIYDDSLLIGLDFLLSEMNKRDMHAVIFMNNFWTWSGGMTQYLSWFGGNAGYDPSSFYNNTAAKEANRKCISNLINRRNTVTDRYYYEDPAIMAWELANEPRPGYSSTYLNQFYSWIDSTAQYIHSLDPNHLVTTGSEGTIGSLNSATIFLRAHQSPFIDYATIHLWAYNWGWYNPMNPTTGTQTYTAALAKAKIYIQQHLAFARTLNKPMTMEEYGLQRDNSSYNAGSPTTYRDQYFNELLNMIYESAATGSPIAGSNFWGWGGEGRSPNSDNRWRTGDPFVCDPPMEAQGLNSVYDTDSSTIQILKQYSNLMSKLKDSNGTNSQTVVDQFRLFQNYPNPFNPITTINYDVKEAAYVQIVVYSILGQRVAILVDGRKYPGHHFTIFDASSLSAGVYFYRIVAGNQVETKKMVLAK
jgi:mannan endo-1,4-beta-mannosidase